MCKGITDYPFSCLASDAKTVIASEPSYVALGVLSEVDSLLLAPGLTISTSCEFSISVL